MFRRTVLNNAFPVYINPAGDRFETAWAEACTRFHAAEEHSTLPAPVADAEYRELAEPLMLDWMRHLLKEE